MEHLIYEKKFLLLCIATTLILCCGYSNSNGTIASSDIVSEVATVSSTENTSEEPAEETTEETTEAAIPEYNADMGRTTFQGSAQYCVKYYLPISSPLICLFSLICNIRFICIRKINILSIVYFFIICSNLRSR